MFLIVINWHYYCWHFLKLFLCFELLFKTFAETAEMYLVSCRGLQVVGSTKVAEGIVRLRFSLPRLYVHSPCVHFKFCACYMCRWWARVLFSILGHMFFSRKQVRNILGTWSISLIGITFMYKNVLWSIYIRSRQFRHVFIFHWYLFWRN